MAESNKGAIAAVFAAGLAAGGGGTGVVQNEQIEAANARADAAVAIVDQFDTHMPTIKTYISNAATLTVTDVLGDRMPKVRADQLRIVSDDIDADLAEGENVPLRELAGTIAGKLENNWLDWYTVSFGHYLQEQVATGVAIGNLSYDQLVRLKDVTDAMRAVSVLHTPAEPAGKADEWQRTLKSLEEVSEEEAEIAARKMNRG